MIDWISIRGFRGIQSLPRTELGRVNLIIGKNDVSKTALMEAIAVADFPDAALGVLATMQDFRVGKAATHTDLEGFWLPLFHNFDASQGIRIERSESAKTVQVVVKLSQSGTAALQPGGASNWELESIVGQEPGVRSRVFPDGAGVRFEQPQVEARRGRWISTDSTADGIKVLLQQLSALKTTGQDLELLTLLRKIEPRLTTLDILAPRGLAAVYVGLANMSRKLPLFVMGQGFQRALDIAAAIAEANVRVLFIDEVENGLHHAVLPSMWSWIKAVAERHSLQIVATTHSEECVDAAAQAFEADDALAFRAIRLDRLADGALRAQSYSARQVLNAESLGVEIRG